MGTYSTAIIAKALDGLSMRAEYTAQNIANAQSPGYAPVRVRFEEALASAVKRSDQSFTNFHPAVESAVGSADASTGVRLDAEIATAASTASRYSALVEVLNRQFQLHSLATTGGR